MRHDPVTESPAGKWTRPDDYMVALARKRGFRRQHRAEGRSEPEVPRLLLSTIPFLALFAALALLAVAIFIAAIPQAEPPAAREAEAPGEPGVAARGWFQEAEKEFHR